MITKISRPRQTSAGYDVYYKDGGRWERREFSTETEADEFANVLETELRKLFEEMK